MTSRLTLARRRSAAAIAGAVGAALLAATGASPVWAAAAPPPAASWSAVGGFGIGDGLEAMIDEQTGHATFALPVAGLQLGWSSSRIGYDRYALGPGWHLVGLPAVDVMGGVRVAPASGGSYEADASAPSGLRGYPQDDVVFRQQPGTLPARSDGRAPAQVYAFTLAETGGTTTYFSAEGAPVARVDRFGEQERGEWDGPRLRRIVSQVGVVTELDWSDPGAIVVTVRAGDAGGGTTLSGTIELDGGRVGAVVDAEGGRTGVKTRSDGLVSTLQTVAGSMTNLTWRTLATGAPAVERVAVVDQLTGETVSSRTWEPVSGVPGATVGRADAASTELFAPTSSETFSTAVGDGASRVLSHYDRHGLLVERELEVSTPAGAMTVQRQAFAYPDADDPLGRPKAFRLPTSTESTFVDEHGASRTVAEEFTYDDLGRVTEAFDGTRYEYNARNQPVAEVRADGAQVETAYWPDRSRRAVRAGEATTTFYWDDTTLVNEAFAAAGGTAMAAYLLGATRHARTVSDGTTTRTEHVVHDRHGSVRELTDAEGAVRTSYDYSDYGVPRVSGADASGGTDASGEADASGTAPFAGLGDAARNPFQFSGEHTDDRGRQYLQARVYDPHTLVFTSQDEADLLNRYWYGDANPIMRIDPSGRDAVQDFMHDWGSFIAGVVLLALGIASIAYTVGNSLALIGIGLEAIGAGFATARLIDDQFDDFMSDELNEGFGWGEIAMGVGAMFSSAAAGLQLSRYSENVLGWAGDQPAIIRLDNLRGDKLAVAMTKTIKSANTTRVEFVTFEQNDLVPGALLPERSVVMGSYNASNRTFFSEVPKPTFREVSMSNHEMLTEFAGLNLSRVPDPLTGHVPLQEIGHVSGGVISLPYRLVDESTGEWGKWTVHLAPDSGHFAAGNEGFFWSKGRKASIDKFFADRGFTVVWHKYDAYKPEMAALEDLNTKSIAGVRVQTLKDAD
ncbi:RHS repeat-associated core domain-containing protein [Agromyces silvae]|uniref:RHS repeat-associated core domain-containing protein n=1 Tax=Agromyces silvae TaxID=3388266 RepID=UPI00280BB604|nr:RHS repeat-associated core domain-containing protein [Agromyces protaetiae]